MARGLLTLDGMGDDEPREDQLQAYENGQDIRNRTYAFACRVAEFCKRLNERAGVGAVMSPQLLKCSTSVAANLEEARAAESTPDFISKCCISLKECREAHIRLRVMEKTGRGPADQAHALCAEANELVAIITAIVRNTKRNAKATMKVKHRSAGKKARIPNS